MGISISKTVALRELDHDPVAIEGHEARLEQLDDLLASLPAKGQLQSLKVRANAEGTHYLVTAGNRRLATLRRLRTMNGAVQGVAVTDSFPVHVIVSEESDADAYESSRAENLQRLPETPVEEFRAFAKMAKVKPAREIAAIFGIVTDEEERSAAVMVVSMPEVISVVTPIFQGGTALQLEVKLRYHLDKGILFFKLVLAGREKLERDGFRTIGERVRQDTGTPVFYAA